MRKRVSRLLTVILALPILAAFCDARSGYIARPENAKPPRPSQASRVGQKTGRPRVADLRNLTLVKEELTAYHDCHCECGCYEQDLERVPELGGALGVAGVTAVVATVIPASASSPHAVADFSGYYLAFFLLILLATLAIPAVSMFRVGTVERSKPAEVDSAPTSPALKLKA